MKRKTFMIPLMLVAAFVVGCGHNSSTSSSSTLPDSSTGPTSSTPILDSSVSTSIPDESITDADVQEKLGTQEKLKAVLQLLPSKSVQSLVLTTEQTFNSNIITATETTQFKSREIWTENQEQKTSGTTTASQYYGYVEGVYYDITKSAYSTFGSREKVAEGEALDKIQQQYVAKLDLTTSLWKDFFSSHVTAYQATLNENTIQIRSKAYYEQKYGENLQYGYEYTFVASFNHKFEIITGSFNLSKYNKDNWDQENHIAIADATLYQKNVATLSAITYGEKELTTSIPMIDMSPYWVTSVSNLYCTTQYLNETTWSYERPENENELFAGLDVIFNDDYQFAPETAIDTDTIRILNSSNENAVKYVVDDYGTGSWIAQTVGETATLTIGNDFHSQLATVEVTVIERPVSQNTPSFASNNEWDSTYSINDQITVTYEAWNETYESAVLHASGVGEVNYLIATQNSAPFDSLEETISFQCLDDQAAVATLSIDEMNFYTSSLPEDYWYYVFIHVSFQTTGTTKYAILSNGETIRELTIVVD